jgi:hypothetical protein
MEETAELLEHSRQMTSGDASRHGRFVRLGAELKVGLFCGGYRVDTKIPSIKYFPETNLVI